MAVVLVFLKTLSESIYEAVNCCYSLQSSKDAPSIESQKAVSPEDQNYREFQDYFSNWDECGLIYNFSSKSNKNLYKLLLSFSFQCLIDLNEVFNEVINDV